MEKGQGDTFATQMEPAPTLPGSAVSLPSCLGMQKWDSGVSEVTHSLISQGAESPEGFAPGRREHHGSLSPLLLCAPLTVTADFPTSIWNKHSSDEVKEKGSLFFDILHRILRWGRGIVLCLKH